MPYAANQHRLFEAAAHDPSVAKRVGIPIAQAQKMASEGVKPAAMNEHQRRAAIAALRRK